MLSATWISIGLRHIPHIGLWAYFNDCQINDIPIRIFRMWERRGLALTFTLTALGAGISSWSRQILHIRTPHFYPDISGAILVASGPTCLNDDVWRIAIEAGGQTTSCIEEDND